MSTNRILDAIQNDSGLSRGDKHPLYRYRVGPERLEELNAALRSVITRPWSIGSTDSAAFVLFAACCFCRNYEGGPWSWRVVEEPLGLTRGLPERDRIVESGLRWWGRTVAISNGRHEYLYSLAREGGLPLSVLTVPGGAALEAYLKKLLVRSEAAGASARAFAEQVIAMLPPRLRGELVISTTSELVDAVVALRRQVPPNCANVLAFLNAELPDWRERLPIYLDGDVAERLLKGLVQGSPPKQERATVELVTELARDPLALMRRLQFPRTMSPLAMALLLDTPVEELPSRIVFHLLTDDGSRWPAVVATQADDYKLQPVGVVTEGIPADNRGGRLLVMGAGCDIASLALPGAESESEVPWVFDHDDLERLPRVRQFGSGRRAGEGLLLALPPGGSWSGPGIIESLGIEGSCEREIVRLRGAADWTLRGESYSFSSGARDDGRSYSLKGPIAEFSKSKTAWLGVPRLKETDPSGGLDRVLPSGHLEWRPVGQDVPWESVSERCLGNVHLRFREDGQTVFRTRTTVLPRRLLLRLIPKSQRGGILELTSSQLERVTCASEGVQCTVERDGDHLRLALDSARDVALCDVVLRFAGGGEGSLRVSYPATLRGFRDASGHLLARNEHIALDNLRRYTAVAQSAARSDGFLLEARVEGIWRPIGELSRTGSEWHLPLSSVSIQLEAAIAGGKGIDTTTDLRVISAVGGMDLSAIAEGTAKLSWHDLEFDVDVADDRAEVHVPPGGLDVLTVAQRSAFKVYAQPLHSPSESAMIPLEEVDHPLRWRFVPPAETKGPWLLTGWVFGELVARPRLIRIGPESTSDDFPDDEFESALRIGGGYERQTALRSVVESIAARIASSKWNRVMEYTVSLGRLPAVTYDVNYAIARVPRTAALVAMRLPSQSDFARVWDGLERLGVVWAAVGIGYWVDGIRVAQSWLRENPEVTAALGSPEEALRRILPGFFQPDESRPRFFSVLHNAFQCQFARVPDCAGNLLSLTRTREGRRQFGEMLRDLQQQHLNRMFDLDDRVPRGNWDSIFDEEQYPMSREQLLSALTVRDRPRLEGPTVAPLAAAYVMAHDISPRRGLLRELRYFRALNEEWFDHAHAIALTVFLGELLEKNDDYLETV